MGGRGGGEHTCTLECLAQLSLLALPPSLWFVCVHQVALPDCDVGVASSDIVASFSGCCGQRCMAASVLLPVGDQPALLKQIVDKAAALKPGTVCLVCVCLVCLCLCVCLFVCVLLFWATRWFLWA